MPDPNIIIKKMQRVLNVPSNSLVFGDVRGQLSKDLLDTLTTIINKKSDHPGVYYILVHSKIDMGARGGQVIKERIILLDKPPEKLLGCALFRIDNKNADATVEWILPLDIPALAPIAPERAKHGQVITDAKGLPIFNRGPN